MSAAVMLALSASAAHAASLPADPAAPGTRVAQPNPTFAVRRAGSGYVIDF